MKPDADRGTIRSPGDPSPTLREGGGSNLKTAEALYSGLPIVVTTAAMRGYGTFIEEPGVLVADDPSTFAAGMRQMFEGRLARRTAGSTLDNLLWTNTLSPMVKLVDDVLTQAR